MPRKQETSFVVYTKFATLHTKKERPLTAEEAAKVPDPKASQLEVSQPAEHVTSQAPASLIIGDTRDASEVCSTDGTAPPPTEPPAPRAKNPRKRFNTEADAAVISPQKEAQRGPKPKPFSERKQVEPKVPKGVPHKAYSREFKLHVISYIFNEKSWVLEYRFNAPRRAGLPARGSWRPPTDGEVAEVFGIQRQSVNRWWKQREELLNSPGRSYRISKGKGRTK